MSLPRKTENGIRYARFATRGTLTRLALMFQAQANDTFTGAQVVEILLSTVQAIGSPEEKDEVTQEALQP